MATLKSKNAILARKRINDLLAENDGSWKAVGDKTGISRGTLYHVYKGDRKPSSKVCEALGLPPELVSVAPCAKCGQLHAFQRRCPGAPTKPRRTYDISYKRLRAVMQSDIWNTE